MPEKTGGLPLWVSGDQKTCEKCQREIKWLDRFSGSFCSLIKNDRRSNSWEQKFVNNEVPYAIEGLKCHNRSTPFIDLRSFKCHNWAYAMPELLEIIERMQVR